jgi:hypothetical protein
MKFIAGPDIWIFLEINIQNIRFDEKMWRYFLGIWNGILAPVCALGE